MTDQGEITTKIPVWEPISFVELLTGNGCIHYYPIVVMKHHEQSNLNKKMFLWAYSFKEGILVGKPGSKQQTWKQEWLSAHLWWPISPNKAIISWNLTKEHPQRVSKYSNTWANGRHSQLNHHNGWPNLYRTVSQLLTVASVTVLMPRVSEAFAV